MTEFTPDETMLNNYTQNKLSELETEQIELWLVDHPDVMQDLEMGVMFKQAKFDPKVVSQTETTKKRSWLQILFSKPALVLSHAGLFLTGMLFVNYISLNNDSAIIGKKVIVSTLSNVRSNTNEEYNLLFSKNQIGYETIVIFEMPVLQVANVDNYVINLKYYGFNQKLYKSEQLSIKSFNGFLKVSLNNTTELEVGKLIVENENNDKKYTIKIVE